MEERFESTWDASYASGPAGEQDDRNELWRALAYKDGLLLLYRAKRLLQINGGDSDAIGAQYLVP